jgi:tetratricopeptide (TPR) repeat protein
MYRRLFVVGSWFAVARAFAQPAASADARQLEQRFRAEVAAVSDEAAVAYDQGNAARDAGRVDDAIAAYRRAIMLAPELDHPHRRLCAVLAAKGQIADAVAACETALSLAPDSPYDKSALGAALLERGGAGDARRGVDLVRQAAEQLPRDVHIAQVWCHAELEARHKLGLTQCSERLAQLDPRGMMTRFYAAVVAGENGKFEEARRLLRDARDAGLPGDVFDAVRADIDKAAVAAAVAKQPTYLALVIGAASSVGLALVFALAIAFRRRRR